MQAKVEPGADSLARRARLRVLSKTIHFAQVPVWAVYGTAVPPGCYPQLRRGAAGEDRVDGVHTRAAVVDKPVETVDSHRQLLVLPTDGGRAGSAGVEVRFGGPGRRRGSV